MCPELGSVNQDAERMMVLAVGDWNRRVSAIGCKVTQDERARIHRYRGVARATRNCRLEEWPTQRRLARELLGWDAVITGTFPRPKAIPPGL